MRHAAVARRDRLGDVLVVFVMWICASDAWADPWAAPGNDFMRHDVELLIDSGVINIPITTWPLSWGDLANAIEDARLPAEAETSVSLALRRLQSMALEQTASSRATTEYRIAADSKPRRLRNFDHTPRENGELSAAYTQSFDRVAVRLQLGFAADPSDEQSVRYDGSYVSAALGNMMVSAGWQERWWGPGHDGALALSTNARPIPGLSVARNFSRPFDTRWLSWLGPWTGRFMVGQLESNRGVPKTRFFGARVAFRPTSSLELGLVRTAQWGGEGRNDSFDTFVDLLLGRDNSGDDGIDFVNEPGNQLAGFDWRWTIRNLPLLPVFYGQLIGEDEAGGFPSRYLGQLGIRGSLEIGEHGDRLSGHVEFSDTTCQFYESSKLFNCAYNSGIYPTGYRYRGRSIGHSTDNDARQISVAATMIRRDGTRFAASLRFARLNRGGPTDPSNSLSPTPSDLLNVELVHERALLGGALKLGLGADMADGDPGGLNGDDLRVFASWEVRR
jgi:hypothetical protein